MIFPSFIQSYPFCTFALQRPHLREVTVHVYFGEVYIFHILCEIFGRMYVCVVATLERNIYIFRKLNIFVINYQSWKNVIIKCFSNLLLLSFATGAFWRSWKNVIIKCFSYLLQVHFGEVGRLNVIIKCFSNLLQVFLANPVAFIFITSFLHCIYLYYILFTLYLCTLQQQ